MTLQDIPDRALPGPSDKPAARRAKPETATGAVTFLDVLGWKGIWQRRSESEPIKLLEDLVELATRTARERRGSDESADVKVVSVSDTIVLLSEGEVGATTRAHGRICARLIPQSIHAGIPIRGATAYGRFATSAQSIFVGPAIDEAAAWHEALDWIGVVLAPSAEYREFPKEPWVKYDRAPVKNLGARPMFVVDWPSSMDQVANLRRIFAGGGPWTPDVAVKYMNTLAFVEGRQTSAPSVPPSEPRPDDTLREER
jgi:hypothetical protein